MINIDAKLSNADWPKRTPDKVSDLAPTSLYRDKLRSWQLDWDESEHPRAEDGEFTDGSGGGSDASPYAVAEGAPRGGEGQQALFDYQPESGSEQALKIEASRGIKEVEKLLEAAVDDANYDLKVESWDEMDSDDQNAVEEHYIDGMMNESGAQEAGWEAVDEYMSEHDLLSYEAVHDKVIEEGDFLSKVEDKIGFELDPDSIEQKNGELNTATLRYKPTEDGEEGQKLTDEHSYEAERIYNRAAESARELLEEDARQSDGATEAANDASRSWAQNEWDELSSDSRLEYAQSHGFSTGTRISPGEPDEWKFDSDREEDEPETDEDYLRTRAIGLELVRERTSIVMKTRGVFTPDIPPEKVAEELWSSWKRDSQSPLGFAMQMAVAEELHTLPTASITDKDKAAAVSAMIGTFTTREERDSWLRKDVPPDSAHAAEREQANADMLAKAEVVAKSRVQAYVRAQWETTQFLLAKAETNRVQMYRAIIRPAEEVSATKQESLPEGTRLPEYRLKQNAVASATTKPNVANGWNGVGVKVEQGKRERVVLRFDAPRTAVFSLPVYGQNVHAESEVVLIGTKGLKWDAWLKEGPEFKEQRIDMALFKVEITMDETPKPPPTENEGPVIDLLKDQDQHWLAPDHYRKPPQKIPPKKPEAK